MGLTQQGLAALTGVQQSTIAAYESGKRQPSDAAMHRLLSGMDARPSKLLERRKDDLKALLRAHGVEHVWVFGSTARGDDELASDIDLMIDLPDDASLFEIFRMQRDAAELLGLRIDIVERGALNPKNSWHAKMLCEAVEL